MTEQDPINVADMLVVHGALRAEIDGLRDLVPGVADGDAARATVVAEHYRLVTMLLGIHHRGEDAVLWPLLIERAPGCADLVTRMRAEHDGLDEILVRTDPAAAHWAAAGDTVSRTDLAAGLADLAAAVGAHLGEEEAQVLPLAARTLTQEEWSGLGQHAQGELAQRGQAAAMLVLGMILQHAPPQAGAAMLAGMPADLVAAWRTDGEPAYQAYRMRLAGAG